MEFNSAFKGLNQGRYHSSGIRCWVNRLESTVVPWELATHMFTVVTHLWCWLSTSAHLGTTLN